MSRIHGGMTARTTRRIGRASHFRYLILLFLLTRGAAYSFFFTTDGRNISTPFPHFFLSFSCFYIPLFLTFLTSPRTYATHLFQITQTLSSLLPQSPISLISLPTPPRPPRLTSFLPPSQFSHTFKPSAASPHRLTPVTSCSKSVLSAPVPSARSFTILSRLPVSRFYTVLYGPHLRVAFSSISSTSTVSYLSILSTYLILYHHDFLLTTHYTLPNHSPMP